ncbi:hypothetical protein CJ030_MR1G013799 [Morella rubra]|uniref:Uncharacterized protein n=1 Tax=Morella rubra TaxID=262757 RepID=A0A6A1WRK3_9ROSI|nr:hypothetical protein CJ030_MR1G013799 [Morella rubra]
MPPSQQRRFRQSGSLTHKGIHSSYSFLVCHTNGTARISRQDCYVRPKRTYSNVRVNLQTPHRRGDPTKANMPLHTKPSQPVLRITSTNQPDQTVSIHRDSKLFIDFIRSSGYGWRIRTWEE